MKLTHKQIFHYQFTNLTVYYFNTGHQLEILDSGRYWGFTPSHKISTTKTVERMVKLQSSFESKRLQTTNW
jgi:hypothetical protein